MRGDGILVIISVRVSSRSIGKQSGESVELVLKKKGGATVRRFAGRF